MWKLDLDIKCTRDICVSSPCFFNISSRSIYLFIFRKFDGIQIQIHSSEPRGIESFENFQKYSNIEISAQQSIYSKHKGQMEYDHSLYFNSLIKP